MKKAKTKSRIYVCHTFYHVYVSILKEMKIARESSDGEYKKADIALSSLSTDFENLGARLAKTGIFNEVIALDEKREEFFPKLAKYRKNYRIRFQRHYPLLQRKIKRRKSMPCRVRQCVLIMKVSL